MLEVFANRRVMLLQGPAGPFFKRVAHQLRQRGATLTKVNFNAGDDLFYRGPEVVHYRGSFSDWRQFVTSLARRARIEVLLLFGDCRRYHRVAIEQARALGLSVYVFEEGYLRPDFVTLEQGGVNGVSSMPKDPAFYRRLSPSPLPKPKQVGNVIPGAAWYATVYAVSHGLLSWRYPHYQHHRSIRPFEQAGLWVRGAARRVLHSRHDRSIDERIASQTLPPYFLVPLQVHLDMQMRHCPFESVIEFIRTVVRSFALHAPKDTVLMLKHHPLDRPYCDYTSLFLHMDRDGSPAVVGLRRRHGQWEEFFSRAVGLDMGLGICPTGKGEDFILLRRIFPLGTRVLGVENGQPVWAYQGEGKTNLIEFLTER